MLGHVLFRLPLNGRIARLFLMLAVLVSGFGLGAAHASTPTVADPDLSVRIQGSGTGSLLTTVHTPALRAAVPQADPRILIIGTGVERALFPTQLQNAIAPAAGPDVTDTHGYGTIAASTLFQLLPNAKITSMRVPARDAGWHLLETSKLADALEYAHANRTRYDLVLLAYPPQAALDPIAHLIGHGDYGRYGRGMGMVIEALLNNRAPVRGQIAGIPADRNLRGRVFARANLLQRDAIERYAKQATAWKRVLEALGTLDRAGVAVVAPSGDFARTSGDQLLPLVTQTVFGVAAQPSVITVGASYADGEVTRLSPTSGRGPTLELDQKPNLLAPSDVMVMIPRGARVGWKDDSLRVPLQTLQWAKAGVPPTPCPSLTGVYDCVLQGSTMVSASVVAANLAASVASGLPAAAAARGSNHDEVLRGLAWAQASETRARASDSNRIAYGWEQGAGVLGGLKGIDVSATPVLLDEPSLGELGWNEPSTTRLALWPGGASVSHAAATVRSFLGADATGATVSAALADGGRLGAHPEGTDLTVASAPGRYQGGFYAGELALTGPSGEHVRLPLSFVQGIPLDFRVTYAYNGLQTGGMEGERVEQTTMVLFAGLPTNVGLIGEAFKNLSAKALKHHGGDPLNNFMIRNAVTKDSFTNPNVTASQHGRGRIEVVPPGFYRAHVLSDHGMDVRQSRGRGESLGIRLGSFGHDVAYVPGSYLFVASQAPCTAGSSSGPMSPSCVQRDVATTEIDPTTGFCVTRNPSTQVAFNVYCGEATYALPSAVVSRAVHLIEHDDLAARSEWKTCSLNVPLDGTAADLAGLQSQSNDCAGSTVPTSWSFPTGSPGCLAPEERDRFSRGHPADVTAIYSGASTPSLPGRNFPVGVMTYEFPLPSPNTYTTAGLALSYVADNAIVAVRFRAGEDALSDSSSSILVIDDPDVNVVPALRRGTTKGSTFTEWATMSANAKTAQLSIIVIPTAWARPDLDPTKPIAKVQLCDVALRVNTFAKQSFGTPSPGATPVQRFTVDDRGLASRIDPSVSRIRPAYDTTSGFLGAGLEEESLAIAVQIPKNTTRTESMPHHVLSPRGNPAYLLGVRDAGGNPMGSTLPTYDPNYGISGGACYEAGLDPDAPDVLRALGGGVCAAWNDAREQGETLGELTPDPVLNGRFAGVLALDHKAVSKAGGRPTFEFADADDGGAFDAAGRWATSKGSYVGRFEVSDFFDDAVPFSVTPLAGLISIARDNMGRAILRVNTIEAGGSGHAISSMLG